MISEPQVLYKLMILYMLHQANLPMTNEQISEFFLSKEYTSYLSLQQAIGELLDAHLITSKKVRTSSRYEITREGETTLTFFGKDISEAIIEDIHTFLKENRIRLRNEMGITADYSRVPPSDYLVRCEVREGKSLLMQLSLSVPTEEQAILICDRWQSASQSVYSSVITELLHE
ncbi:MAG: DUF4364 family protein [Lachnospiraceae bacterium]|nr:DUF4364 family protein [Lachnospiraceae bacterium]